MDSEILMKEFILKPRNPRLLKQNLKEFKLIVFKCP